MSEQEKSRIILEWAGLTVDHWPDGSLSVWANGEYPGGFIPNLYTKENLWILFEYVIPKLRDELRFDHTFLILSNVLHNWVYNNCPPISEALCDAILENLEASCEG